MRYAQQYHYLWLLCALNITMQLVCDVTAGRLIDVWGYTVSVTVLYFPLTYLISDLVTEVYGYKAARRVLLYTLGCSILAGLTYQLAVAVPAISLTEQGDAYKTVLNQVPRILVAGWLAVFTGDILNNYVLAKLKVMTKGRFLWLRTISSTILGQSANTAVFYVLAFSFVLPAEIIFSAIIAGSVIKIFVEILFTPVTYWAVSFLKKIESVDFYDTKTDFNPFAIDKKGGDVCKESF